MSRFIGTFARGVVSRTMGADSLEVSVMQTKLNKKLTLSRETVRELTDSQLGQAVGGSDSVEACQLSQGCHQSRPSYICNTITPCYHC